MKNIGGAKVNAMIMHKQMIQEGKKTQQLDEETENSKKKVSKLIIGPNNYWNLQWNNLI